MFGPTLVCFVLCILFHCDVLCTVCVKMYTVLMPPGVKPIAVNKYINITSPLDTDVQLHALVPLPLHSLNIRVRGSQDQAGDTHTFN